MPKSIEECKELDIRFKGTINDYDETLDVRYYIDKKHYVWAKFDLFKGILRINDTEVKWSKGAVI